MHYGQLRKRLQIIEAVRSGLEAKVIEDLKGKGVDYGFETVKVFFAPVPKRTHYTPDIVLPNGILIECKGIFESKDRTKHLNVKAAHPELDIRFVFSRSSEPLRKGAASTYADWCEKHGFLYADKLIPQEWLKECAGTSLAHITASADIKQTTNGTRTKRSSPTSKSTSRKSPSKKQAS